MYRKEAFTTLDIVLPKFSVIYLTYSSSVTIFSPKIITVTICMKVLQLRRKDRLQETIVNNYNFRDYDIYIMILHFIYTYHINYIHMNYITINVVWNIIIHLYIYIIQLINVLIQYSLSKSAEQLWTIHSYTYSRL